MATIRWGSRVKSIEMAELGPQVIYNVSGPNVVSYLANGYVIDANNLEVSGSTLRSPSPSGGSKEYNGIARYNFEQLRCNLPSPWCILKWERKRLPALITKELDPYSPAALDGPKNLDYKFGCSTLTYSIPVSPSIRSGMGRKAELSNRNI